MMVVEYPSAASVHPLCVQRFRVGALFKFRGVGVRDDMDLVVWGQGSHGSRGLGVGDHIGARYHGFGALGFWDHGCKGGMEIQGLEL